MSSVSLGNHTWRNHATLVPTIDTGTQGVTTPVFSTFDRSFMSEIDTARTGIPVIDAHSTVSLNECLDLLAPNQREDFKAVELGSKTVTGQAEMRDVRKSTVSTNIKKAKHKISSHVRSVTGNHGFNPESTPSRPTGAQTRSESDIEQTVIAGDAWKVLDSLASETVDMWVTSPPYHKARTYTGCNAEVGTEGSVQEYITNLVSIVIQLMRVTKSDGIGWLVIDDSYTDGALSLIPQRLSLELQREGYTIVHQSPWVKSDGGKPDPADSRFSQRHEKVLCLAQVDSDRWFTPQAAETTHDVFRASTGNTYDSDHSAVYSEDLIARMIRATCPPKVCANCGAPYEAVYKVTDILDLPAERSQNQNAIETAHKALEEGALTREHLHACRAVGLSDQGQGKAHQNGAGKNADRTQELFEEAREYFMAEGQKTYTRCFCSAKEKLTGYTQKCSCDSAKTKPGLVLDPFLGSGTTGVVAKRLNRRWTGIELDAERATEAEQRIRSIPKGSTLNSAVPDCNQDTKQRGLSAFTTSK